MSLIDARTVPADPVSAQRLAEGGFDLRVVDLADPVHGAPLIRAVFRGFLGDEPTDERLTEVARDLSFRRPVGVFRAGADAGDEPVATVESWVTRLSIPGGEIPMWAISGVTVAATHRRRGIARNMLEGELRAAADAGLAVAGLTVTEATIYSRYGFGPAVPAAHVEIDTRRAGWIAPDVPGTLEYVSREQLAADLEQVHEAARRRPGQIDGWSARWRGMAGLLIGDTKSAAVRGVRYRDADGAVRGAVAYVLTEHDDTHTLDIRHLAAADDEALRALWSFAIHHDLVSTVKAGLRPVDDPVVWMVADQRAVAVKVHDHGWLRVLDVPAALQARRYEASVDTVVRVGDALGFADGVWRLSVGADGIATVERTSDDPVVTMGAVELAALYAGGVSATQLAAAGRVTGAADAVAALDRAFRTAAAPTLGIWY